MCLLALLIGVVEKAPLVVGANREELYARGGTPPQLLPGPLPAVGGVDPTAGGTWLGVNARGVLVAVTNRARSEMPTRPRSRGLLVRELLACPTAAEALDRAAQALDGGAYAGCNLVCADARQAGVVHGGDWLRVRLLPPGVHVLSNRDVNDETDRRVGYARAWLESRRFSSEEEVVGTLRDVCASHEPPQDPICFHGAQRGTVSSSLLVLRPDRPSSAYLHAQGPPDRTPYTDFSDLFTLMR